MCNRECFTQKVYQLIFTFCTISRWILLATGQVMVALCKIALAFSSKFTDAGNEKPHLLPQFSLGRASCVFEYQFTPVKSICISLALIPIIIIIRYPAPLPPERLGKNAGLIPGYLLAHPFQ